MARTTLKSCVIALPAADGLLITGRKPEDVPAFSRAVTEALAQRPGHAA